MKKKNEFTITITAKDLAATAPGSFSQPGKCLIATALKRRGSKNVSVGVVWARIDGRGFCGFAKGQNYIGSSLLLEDCQYKPEVVGLKISFKAVK